MTLLQLIGYLVLQELFLWWVGALICVPLLILAVKVKLIMIILSYPLKRSK